MKSFIFLWTMQKQLLFLLLFSICFLLFLFVFSTNHVNRPQLSINLIPNQIVLPDDNLQVFSKSDYLNQTRTKVIADDFFLLKKNKLFNLKME